MAMVLKLSPASSVGPIGSRISLHCSSSSSLPGAIFLRRRRSIVSASSSAASANSSRSSSPAPSLSDLVWPSAGAFASMAAMSVLDKHLQQKGLSFLIAPFGAVCCVLFATPNAPAAQRYNVLMAHMGCSLIGVLALAAFGPGWMARSVALSASIVFMEITKCLHPPAAGLPLLFIDGPKFHHLQWWYILFPSTLGCLLLIVMQEAVKFLKDNAKF
ncbi:transmembrane protein DDB_G0273707/DDB_G0273361 [Selaginella moellendorffii]|uniref:transmembrane protein DDB_G0273707/DDB_G0273361 n=1 Tax=Selaginella moellendorffii TaxID=88036 RepID=UPI000D1C65B0|nr:transmembrane protein DDB_G0273707/DDB_G0273361 [Selaginella moellendorffii]|eukprot:XP_002967623.2 transmembrane protein DDB_G0273707/DDB_G0273361 [Selaginella moellendorffii]